MTGDHQHRPRLTILTDVVPHGRWGPAELAIRASRLVRDSVKPRPAYVDRRYRGHFAVTRSAVEGLGKIGVHATYNPLTRSGVADVVVVLSGVRALRQAIEWRRRGMIRRLLAGPNIVNVPADAGSIICSPEIDLVITPSTNVAAFYVTDCPELKDRCAVWPAGVDTTFWRPDGRPRLTKRLLWFEKRSNGPLVPLGGYRAAVEKQGFEVVPVIYGQYISNWYRDALRSSSALIGFTNAESQGIAWAEAWACDVPTMLFYRDSMAFDHYPGMAGRVFQTSTAPYLTRATGLFFRNEDDFVRVLAEWDGARDSFAPRAWVLENMSDDVAARSLCELAGVEVS